MCVCSEHFNSHQFGSVYCPATFPYFQHERIFRDGSSIQKEHQIYIYIHYTHSFTKTGFENKIGYCSCSVCAVRSPHPDTHIYILFIMVFVALVCVVDGVVLDDFVCVCACVVDGSTFDLLHVLAKTTTFRIAHAAYSVRVKERNESKKKNTPKYHSAGINVCWLGYVASQRSQNFLIKTRVHIDERPECNFYVALLLPPLPPTHNTHTQHAQKFHC